MKQTLNYFDIPVNKLNEQLTSIMGLLAVIPCKMPTATGHV